MTRARDLADSADKDIAGTLTVDDLTASGDVTIAGDLTVTGSTTGGGGSSGTHTGDVVGNVTGNLTGDVTGNTTGTHTGDVTGNLTGDVTGNVNFSGDVDFGANKITYANVYANLSDLPSASTYHGMFAHVHATGKAYYSHGGNWIELNSGLGIDDNATSTAVTLDASGNLLVGKTSSATNTVGVEIDGANGVGVFTRDGNTAIEANRKTSDGSIVNFRKDGSTVGSISASTNLNIGSGSTRIWFRDSNNALRPVSSEVGHGSDGVIDIGEASGGRFKDLYLSGGVYLGGTGSANRLNDVETGTWTPTYATTGTGFTSVSYQAQVGKYTKIGNIVTLVGTLDINSSGLSKGSASGAVVISGQPFTVISSTSSYSGSVSQQTQWTQQPSQIFARDDNTLGLGYIDVITTYDVIVPSDMNGSGRNRMRFTITYMTSQ